MDDLIYKLYPEISRFLLSGALLELRHVSECFRGILGKLYQINEQRDKPLIERLSSSYILIYYLNYSDIPNFI